MKSISFICGEEIVEDQRTGALYAHKLFDSLEVLQFPVIIPQITFLNLLERLESEPEKHEFNLTLRLDGVEIFRVVALSDFRGGTVHRNIIRIQQLAVPRPGRFQAIFRLEKQEISRYELVLRQAPIPAAR